VFYFDFFDFFFLFFRLARLSSTSFFSRYIIICNIYIYKVIYIPCHTNHLQSSLSFKILYVNCIIATASWVGVELSWLFFFYIGMATGLGLSCPQFMFNMEKTSVNRCDDVLGSVTSPFVAIHESSPGGKPEA
jgi:hypothetical protein